MRNESVCNMTPACQSSSPAVCHLIRYGETSRHANPRCGCRCHDDEKKTVFMSVEIPGFFREIEVHRNTEERSSREWKHIYELEETARRLYTWVEITEFRRG
jgi:hypothetical protein